MWILTQVSLLRQSSHSDFYVPFSCCQLLLCRKHLPFSLSLHLGSTFPSGNFLSPGEEEVISNLFLYFLVPVRRRFTLVSFGMTILEKPRLQEFGPMCNLSRSVNDFQHYGSDVRSGLFSPLALQRSPTSTGSVANFSLSVLNLFTLLLLRKVHYCRIRRG